MSILEQLNNYRKSIRYENMAFSLWELVDMHLSNPQEITIRPEFQRLFRWSREQQSNFIESILLEIPVPPLFFFSSNDGTWDLLDGLQRFSTLIRFLGANGQIPSDAQGESGNEADWHYLEENNLVAPLQLLEGRYFTALKGRTFKSLPILIQLYLKRTRLQIYVIKRETHTQYKYEIFKRINWDRSVLEAQEVRSCGVRLLDNKFPEFIEKISGNRDFSESLGLKNEYSRKGYEEELALGFFAMKNKMDTFKNEVGSFLTNYMEEVARGNYNFDYSSEASLFEETFKLINNVLSDGHAFREKTAEGASIGPFSPSVFEAVSIGLASNIDKVGSLTAEQLKDNLVHFIQNLKSERLIGAGSNSRTKTLERIKAGIKNFDL